MPPLPRCLLALAPLCLLVSGASAQEFRALWADTFHAALRNASEVTALVQAARDANCNAVIVEVRKRGDAYYRNGLEPVATDVAAGFDPLADLIQKARTGGPRIEVHAWMVTYNIWNKALPQRPPQPDHPFNLHPEWVTEKYRASASDPVVQFDGANYQLDPGHPEVQDHTYRVAMDILTRYNIDGLHFDYIRYSEYDSTVNSQPWGYNPTTLARYRRLSGRTGTPTPSDAAWLQWRRDQVTALLRRVYLNAMAAKPHVRVSAALIPWGTAPSLPDSTHSGWRNTNAYARVLQDWRGWMEEGILDLACPMVYRSDNPGFSAWVAYVRERQYNREAAIGMGWYNNSVANTIQQIKLARQASTSGLRAKGVVGYSYAVTNNQSIPRSEMLAALTQDAAAETYDPGGDPVFPTPVAVPAMPWKTSTTRGHLMGQVQKSDGSLVFDGAAVQLSGPVNRTLISDATGFFGMVDLLPGSYTLSVTLPNYDPITRQILVPGGRVTQATLPLVEPAFQVESAAFTAAGDKVRLVWPTRTGESYRIEASSTLSGWTTVVNSISGDGFRVTVDAPVSGNRRFYRVVRQ